VLIRDWWHAISVPGVRTTGVGENRQIKAVFRVCRILLQFDNAMRKPRFDGFIC
jgi:hypothetical protein